MRHCPLLAFPLLLCPLAMGCISSSNAPPPAGEDGGLGPFPDATVPADAAPGVDGSTVSDSAPPPSDGSISDTSAPPPLDGGAGAVSVVVVNDVGVEPGIQILFSDQAGALLGTATTDATGTASAMLAPNAQVTIVFGTQGNYTLTTIQGVQPGDKLQVFDTVDLAYPVSTYEIDALPDASAYEDAATYFNASAGGCGEFQSTSALGEQFSIEYPCDYEGVFPILYLVENADEEELAYSYQKGNMLLSDGGITHVSITQPLMAGETVQTVSASNMPPFTEGFNANFSYSEIAGDVMRPFSNALVSAVTDDAGVESISFPGHPGYPDAVQTEMTLTDTTSATLSSRAIATRAGAPDGSTTYPTDLSQALPEITNAGLDATDAGTPGRPVISWTSAGPLTSADGILVLVAFEVNFDDGGGGSSEWTIFTAPTSTRVTPPALPPSFGTWTADPAIPTVAALAATFANGYGELRQKVGSLPPLVVMFGSTPPIIPVLPVNGTLSLTAVTPALPQ